MKAGQWIYYITRHIKGYNDIASCNLPSVGFHRIKDSPYKLMLAKS